MNRIGIYMIFLQILLSVFATAVALVVLKKTRRIHIATDELLVAGRETRTLFAQIQALIALERKLGLSEPLPAVRGWAGSPDFLLVIANEILARKPRTVMECSSGVSTVVIARCLQINGGGHVFSLEHDTAYAAKSRQQLVTYGLADWGTVLDAPLESESGETPWYSEKTIPTDLAPIDILVVDGPPAATGRLARFPALPRLAKRMAKKALVIVDDANRPDEIEMARRWKTMFPNGVSTDAHCEKGCITIEFDERRSAV